MLFAGTLCRRAGREAFRYLAAVSAGAAVVRPDRAAAISATTLARPGRRRRRGSRRRRALPGTAHHHPPGRASLPRGFGATRTRVDLFPPPPAAAATSQTEHVGEKDAAEVRREDDVDAEVHARVEDGQIVGQLLDVVVRLSAAHRLYADQRQHQPLEERRGLTDDEDDDDDDEDDGDAVVARLLASVHAHRTLVDGGGRATPTAHRRQQPNSDEDQRRQRHDVHHQVETHVLVDDLEPEAAAYLGELQLSDSRPVIGRLIGLCRQVVWLSRRRVRRWIMDLVLEDARQTVADSEHRHDGDVDFRSAQVRQSLGVVGTTDVDVAMDCHQNRDVNCTRVCRTGHRPAVLTDIPVHAH